MSAAPVLYDGMLCLFGTVAAVERGDQLGWQLLRHDLPGYFATSEQLLTAIALATLDRLGAITESTAVPVSKDDIENVAQQLVASACSYGISPRSMVRTAAKRLDTLSKNDEVLSNSGTQIGPHTADDQIDGAVALLTATIALWARRTGQSPRKAASDLCLAASYRPSLT